MPSARNDINEITMNLKTQFPLLFKTLEILVVSLAVALVNLNSLVRIRQFPEVDNYSDHEGNYILAALLTTLLMIVLLRADRQLGKYFQAWGRNKPLILFLAYATVSLLWTVYLPATLYKLIFLIFSSLAGAYLAVRYQVRGVLNALCWVGAVFAILSLLVIVNFPLIGIMQNRPFIGSWVGIFWHRNHTGNLFAFFSMLFLLRIVMDGEASRIRKLLFAVLYLLSAAMVFGSRSATGVIVYLFLHFAAFLTIFWLRVRERLKPWHYYLAGALLLAGFLIFITNTAFFFGLLGRSANMTGRIPLWQDLFSRVYMQEPVLGYGYGALWMQKSFRIAMQIQHGWPYQVYFADNGFFDILLNTGLVGLLLFLGVYLTMGVRAYRQALTLKSWMHFVPLLTFLYIFIGNLTYSFLLEVDQFVWMLLVVMAFLTSTPSRINNAQPYRQPSRTNAENEV